MDSDNNKHDITRLLSPFCMTWSGANDKIRAYISGQELTYAACCQESAGILEMVTLAIS